MSLPTFVVAGAARAGSTALAEALRRHPDVFVTRPKEPHYLALGGRPAAFTGPDDETTINAHAVTDLRAYLALYPDREEALRYRALGEASVSSLYYHHRATGELARLNPAARVVIVLRDPVERAWSSHQYLLNRGSEPEADLLTAVDQEQRRIDAGWHHLWHYTAMSRYADGLEAFLTAFGPEQTAVWWHEELGNDASRCLAEVQQHIGVTPHPDVSAPRVNASGSPRRAWVQSAIQRASAHPRLRATIKAVVPFDARERIRNGNLRRHDVPGRVREALEPFFADDLARVESLLGRPVPSTWRSASRA